MAKGKGKPAYGSRKASAADLAEFDDSSSTWSGPSPVVEDHMDEERLDNVYEHSLDLLLEKRGATRVKALEDIVAFLKADVRDEESQKNCLTMLRCCLVSLRKGGTQEKALAATAIGLHLVSLPETVESLFVEVQPALDVAAQDGSAAVRSAAIEALAMACYVVAEGDDITQALMERMQELWARGEAGPRAAALRGWTLLFTSLRSIMSAAEVESVLQQMTQFIGDKSVDVRSAAGSLVAVLCGSYKFLQAGNGDQSVSADFGDADSQASSSDVVDFDGLVDRMRDLATHNRQDTLRTSKRDKASLRATFRSILETVEEGAVKTEKIKLRYNDVMVVDTLDGKVALDAFKRLLGTGLQAHLQRNPLLHSVFGFTPSAEAPARLTATEKRQFRSPSSFACKGKTADRKLERAFKSSRQGCLLEDDY